MATPKELHFKTSYEPAAPSETSSRGIFGETAQKIDVPAVFPGPFQAEATSFLSIKNSLHRYLLHNNLLSTGKLSVTLKEQEISGRPFIDTLIQLGFFSPEELRHHLSTLSGWPAFNPLLPNHRLCPSFCQTIPMESQKRYRLAPLRQDAETYRYLVVEPPDAEVFSLISRHHPETSRGIQTSFYIVTQQELEHLWTHADPSQPLPAKSLSTLLHHATLSETIDGSMLVEIVDLLIEEALKKRASDIHLEPNTCWVNIRYRIDGVLQEFHAIHVSLWPSLRNRLKVLARANIAETRHPQDGRFSFQSEGSQVDCRIAFHPTAWGENIVIRLLRSSQESHKLHSQGIDSLLLTESLKSDLKRIVHSPEGLVWIVGPTGSGKTTTLYALLREIASTDLNIMTLEDPIEYTLPGVRQSQVWEEFSFADGIRSLLRQNPDVILVGEVRDAETAHMTIQAALTGHKVFATLHATTLSTFQRLEDLGVSISSSLEVTQAVVGQRLVRRCCPRCSPPHGTPSCSLCHGTGFYGRLPLLEILELPRKKSQLSDLENHLERSLWDEGRLLVQQRLTTEDELRRVLPPLTIDR